MSVVESEVILLKDTLWRLTGRVLVLENFISKTFGNVLDSCWTCSSKSNNSSGGVEKTSLVVSNTKRSTVRKAKLSPIKKAMKTRRVDGNSNNSVLDSSNVSQKGRSRISMTEAYCEEDSSDHENQMLNTVADISLIKTEHITNESDDNEGTNGVEEWENQSSDENEGGVVVNAGNMVDKPKTNTTYDKSLQGKSCGPLPPLEELPFILRGSYFKVIQCDGVILTAECQKCLGPNKALIRGQKNTTSNFVTHLKRLHPEILEEYQLQRPIGKKRRTIGLSPIQPQKKSVDKQPNNSHLSVSASNESSTSNILPNLNNQEIEAMEGVTYDYNA